jgi:alcohol dehydrogenase (cytochrome c)
MDSAKSLLRRQFVLGTCLAACMSVPALPVKAQDVTYERLLHAQENPANWITYYGSYNGSRFSTLKQIDTSNVQRLVVKWAFQTGPDENFEVTPLVIDGTMYITNNRGHVFALDAATGRMIWRYNPEVREDMPVRIWGAGGHRGVSVVNGKVLVATADAFLLALDAKTGKLLWKQTVGDYLEGQALASPPLVVKDKAIIGISTAEFPTRGFIDAYQVDTGKRLWRFYTVPGPNEPGNETWSGDSWKAGCGPAWLPGTFDPELNLTYFGTGNPCAMWNGQGREGDNLYTSSILALDPDNGLLRWHFQSVPHDVLDYDATSELILVDLDVDGRPTKALIQAEKNGYFYALDRLTGRFIYGKPFVERTNWTKGLDPEGRPVPGVLPTEAGAMVCPSATGAKSWNHMAYSPLTGYAYIPGLDVCAQVKTVKVEPKKGTLYLGGDGKNVGEGARGFLAAVDTKTGDVKWRYTTKYPIFASVLATAGGLLFTGDLEGNALALEASDGRVLWKFQTGSGHRGSPITYALNGKQYIAIPSGWGGVTQAFLPNPDTYPELSNATKGSTLFVYGLPER